MDATVYRHPSGEINRRPCVFARALAARQAVCEMAVRDAARPAAMLCAQPVARAACAQLLHLWRRQCSFALGVGSEQRALRPAQAERLQCGGLDGLRDRLDAGAHSPDVHQLVRKAQAEFGSLDRLPQEGIVRAVAAWSPPRA